MLLEINSLLQQISDQNSNSNEKHLLKISSLVATTGMPKCKRKSNEDQFKLNSQVMLKLDEAEQSMESSNIDKSKEKNVEGKKKNFFSASVRKKKKRKKEKIKQSQIRMVIPVFYVVWVDRYINFEQIL